MSLLYGLALSSLIAALALWRGALSRSGALGALIVGTLTFGFGGPLWGLLLVLFFVSSSGLSHFRAAQKKAAADKFEKGHARDFFQAMANGGLGALVAMLSAWVPWPGWLPLFVGIMATVNADTWATELGTLSRRLPRLITTGRAVETGTSGGISSLGTLASILGGAFIGLVAGLLGGELTAWTGTLLGSVAGLVGSLVDSILGATVQRMYYCDYCRKDTERRLHPCGHETRLLRGWSWLNNDSVNLFASIAGGLIALGLWGLVRS